RGYVARNDSTFRKKKGPARGIAGPGRRSEELLVASGGGGDQRDEGEGTASHPPSRNFQYSVARGIRFSFQNQITAGSIPWNVRTSVWLHETLSTFDATGFRDHSDEESPS